MRRDLLSIWRCPNCSSPKLALSVSDEGSEIITGTLRCRTCEYINHIDQGIVHTRPKLSAGVKNEVANARQFTDPEQGRVFPLSVPVVLDDSWLLSLPTPAYHAGAWNPIHDIQSIIQRYRLKPGDRVLDLGAGVCWTSRELAMISDHVVAVDILDDKYLGLASAATYISSTGRYFERINASMDHLPFRDQSFDLILTNCSAHHADNLAGLLVEIKRVLKPNGQYVMSNELTQGWLKHSPLVGNDHFFRLGDYLRTLRQTGFRFTTVFPRSILMTLAGGGQGRKDGRWRSLGVVAGRLYRLPGASWMIERLRQPLSRLLGIPLIIIAQPK